MDIKQIRKLAEILEQSGLSAVEVCEKDTKIRLERNITVAPSIGAAAVNHAVAAAETVALNQGGVITPKPTADGLKGEVDFNNMSEIKSPMVGVFYRGSSPDTEPYVKIGDKVKKGAVLCIVEAMKLMNEITADCDGEILDICAQDGQVVEYGQTLFKLF